jgi:hypothetical protein
MTCFHVFSFVLWCPLRFPRKNDVQLVSRLFCRGFMFYLCYLYLFMYAVAQYDTHRLNLRSDDFNFNPWFSSFLVSSNPLLRKFNMNTNREIYTTYRGAVGIILHINRMLLITFSNSTLRDRLIRLRFILRIEYLVLGKGMSYLNFKKTFQILIKSHVCFIHWLTHRHYK